MADENAPTGPLDLRTIKAEDGAPSNPTNTGSPTGVREVNLEDTRRRIAYFLLGILTLVVVIEVLGGSILAVNCWLGANANGACPAAQASLSVLTTSLGAVFTAMIGLVGSVVGFYFGSKSTSS